MTGEMTLVIFSRVTICYSIVTFRVVGFPTNHSKIDLASSLGLPTVPYRVARVSSMMTVVSCLQNYHYPSFRSVYS